MKKISIIIIVALFTGVAASGQSGPLSGDRVSVQCDRPAYLPGDTLWWRAVVTGKDGFSKSTNLYTELWTDDGKIVSRRLYAIIQGQSTGDFTVPDSLLSGKYWLRIYTRRQLLEKDTALLKIPVNINHSATNSLSSPQTISNSDSIEVKTDTLGLMANGFNSWSVTIHDQDLVYWSCAVTNEDVAQSGPICTGSFDSTDVGMVDTSYLTYILSATTKSGKQLSNTELVGYFQKGADPGPIKVFLIDQNGRFMLNNLFFFGEGYFHYQLNGKNASKDEISLKVDEMPVPAFDIPKVNFPAAYKSVGGVYDTLAFRSKVRKLQEVRIKGYRNPRTHLDSVYATGIFSNPTLYSFDVRKQKYDIGLGEYLHQQLSTGYGNSASDPPAYPFKPPLLPYRPIIFYLNDKLVAWGSIFDLSLKDIAYIKAFPELTENNEPSLYGGGIPPVTVAIYTRKGKDILPAPSLNTLALNGYEQADKFVFNKSNRSTILWLPLATAKNARLRFHNNSGKTLRLTILAADDKGKIFTYSRIIR